MNKITKRIFAVLLLASMLSALSCGNGTGSVSEDTSVQTTEAVTTEEVNPDPLPAELKFEGETVNFYSCDYIYNRQYAVNFVEEENGEILNDSQYETERYVEERLGIEIIETLGPETVNDFDKEAKALILSGDDTYDLITNMDRLMIADVTEGMFRATSDLPHVNLDAEYWNPDATSRFSVGNKIYYALTSFNLCSYSNTNVMYMNLDVAAKHGINDIYDTVRDGKWTYDVLKELSSDAYLDLNGNSEKDEEDQFGYTPGSEKNSWLNAVVGAGLYDDVMHKDTNDFFVYEISSKLYDVLEMFYKLDHSPYAFSGEGATAFDKTASLFHESTLAKMSAFRELEFDFSVLPIPKYDLSQEKYACRTYDTFFTMVPVTCTRTELCGAVLESLSYKAHTDLLPAYINDTLQVKLARDDDSAEMIRIALDCRAISIAEAYMFDLWGNYNMWAKYIRGTNESPASYIDSIKDQTIAKIDSYNEFFRTLGE